MNEQHARIVKLYDNGMMPLQIAKQTGIEHIRVEYIVNQYRKSKNVCVPKITHEYKKLRDVQIGGEYLYRDIRIRVLARTFCSECIVNKDHSFETLCLSDACEKRNRKDGTDVMFELAGD